MKTGCERKSDVLVKGLLKFISWLSKESKSISKLVLLTSEKIWSISNTSELDVVSSIDIPMWLVSKYLKLIDDNKALCLIFFLIFSEGTVIFKVSKNSRGK